MNNSLDIIAAKMKTAAKEDKNSPLRLTEVISKKQAVELDDYLKQEIKIWLDNNLEKITREEVAKHLNK